MPEGLGLNCYLYIVTEIVKLTMETVSTDEFR